METNRVKIVTGLGLSVLIVFLCAAAGVTGYFVGQRSATSTPEVSEQIEIVEVTTVPAAEATAPPELQATAIPEVTPTEPSPAAEPPALPGPTIEADAFLDRNGEFTENDLRLMWEVWSILEREYDGELPDDGELTYAMVRALLDTLGDEFTRFAPPDVAARMREDLQGSFEGIGAFVEENDEGLTEIVRPMDGQPAQRAGLLAGDVVVGVNGESMIGKSLDEVIALIRGPRGTTVTITIGREGLDEPFDVTITRERIEIPIVEARMLEDDIAYVWLTSFSRNAESQLAEALEDLLAQNPTGLILDLRDNPGGFLDQSIAVADLFLPESVVLYERSRTLGIDEIYRAGDGDLAETIPLVVLVNAGSASASEIVAGAIRDNGRGVLIGETTFGKGSVQQSHTLADGSELRVTIARWYIPSDVSIDDEGIVPHIEVETPASLGGDEDTQLQRAVEFLLNGE